VATATQRRGWNIDSVTKDQKTDLEKARLIRARQRAIGRELRRMFDSVAKEPVPDDFLELLRRVDESGIEGGNKES
jgi:Anti-sigma factor NepR